MERKEWVEEGEEASAATSAAPFLLISYDGSGIGYTYDKQSLYNVSNNRYYNTNIPKLENYRVLGSSHGWFVLVGIYSGDCVLWNPKSMEEIQLPLLEDFYTYNTCVLSKAPTEADCHIVFNLDYGPADVRVQSYCKIGDDVLKVTTRDEYEYWGDEMMLLAMRSFKGRIYGVVGSERMPRGLVSIDFDADDLMNIRPAFDFGDELDLQDGRYYLVECDDEVLFLVHKKKLFGNYYDLRLFRVDPDRMECVEVGNIGDRTIFVSDMGDAFCCSSSLNKTNHNTIYCAVAMSRTLYVYHLDDGSITHLLPSPAIPRNHTLPFWIQQQPAQRLLRDYY